MFVEIHEGRRGAGGLPLVLLAGHHRFGDDLSQDKGGTERQYSIDRHFRESNIYLRWCDEAVLSVKTKMAPRARRVLSAEQGMTILKRRCPDDFRRCAVIFGEMLREGIFPGPIKTREDLKPLIPDFLFSQGQMDWQEIRKFVNYVNTKNYSAAELKGFWRGLRSGIPMEGEDVRWWFQVLGDYMNTAPNEHGSW